MSLEASLMQVADAAPAHPSQMHRLTRWAGTADVVTIPGALLVLVAAFALVFRSANPDVTWLLSVGERWLAGERLYVDLIEVNPPASVLIYMPAILLARLLGCSSDIAVTLLVTLGCAASVGLTCTILRRGGLVPADSARPVLWGMLVLVSIVPMSSFGQREHIATLAALPWLAALAVRSEGRSLTLGLALLAGLGGGIAMAIKPMFALGFAGPLLFLAMRGGWRRLVSAWDLHVAWAVTGAYGIAVLLLFPAFVAGPLGWVLLAYVPLRHALPELLLVSAATTWLGLLACDAMLWRRGHGGTMTKVATLSSIGFGAVYFLQGKGWAYQAMPAILLAGVAGWSALAATVRSRAAFRVVWPLALATTTCIGCAAAAFDNVPTGTQEPGLAAAIVRLAPHPRMLTIGSDIADGHPLVRLLGGRWVGSFCSNWITAALAFRRDSLTPEAREQLQALSAMERAIVTHDIATGRPDVILLEDGQIWSDYIARSPALSAALAAFRPAGHYGTITLLVRTHAPGREPSL